MKIDLKNLVVRFLGPNEEVIAKKLIYDVYIGEMKWNPKKDNPSKIHVETLSDSKKILTDCHDARAKWMGCFYKGQLIGCGRLCPRDQKKRFELHYYLPNNTKLNTLLGQSEPSVVELSRGAVHKDYRGSGLILIVMLKFLCSYCLKNKTSILTTVGIESMKTILKNSGWPKVPGIQFKYEEHDPAPVDVYFADFKKGEIHRMISKIDSMLKRIAGKNRGERSFWKSTVPIVQSDGTKVKSDMIKNLKAKL